MSLLELGPPYWALMALAFIAGGTVKGVIGMGMPLVVVPAIASFTEPVVGVALVSVPVVSANLWQFYRSGHIAAPARRFIGLIIPMMVVMWLASRVFIAIDAGVAATIMGAIVIVFTISRRFPIHAQPGPEAERWLGPAVGTVTGLVGGITGLISPPMTMYLVSLRLPREEFIGAIALLLLCGSAPLYANLAIHDILTVEVLVASCIGTLPAWLGVAIGAQLRRRISQGVFEHVLLAALFLIGLNLLRRGLF